MTVFGAEEQRVERLTTFVSLFLALLLQLAAGLLLVGMCREEVLTRQPPVPLITVNLAPEPAPAGPAKIAAPASPSKNPGRFCRNPNRPVPEPQPAPEPEKRHPGAEVIQPPEAAPIEPPAVQKTEELKNRNPQRSPESAKTVAKPIEKPVENQL